MPFHVTHHTYWVTAMCLVSGYALWRGEEPERLASIANVAAWLATLVVQARTSLDSETAMLWVDAAFLAFLLWQALTRDRVWLLFAAAFQLLAMVTHLASLADAEVGALAYLKSLAIWGYLFLAALGAGTFAVARRRFPKGPHKFA
jgi:hypothetical protein